MCELAHHSCLLTAPRKNCIIDYLQSHSSPSICMPAAIATCPILLGNNYKRETGQKSLVSLCPSQSVGSAPPKDVAMGWLQQRMSFIRDVISPSTSGMPSGMPSPVLREPFDPTLVAPALRLLTIPRLLYRRRTRRNLCRHSVATPIACRTPQGVRCRLAPPLRRAKLAHLVFEFSNIESESNHATEDVYRNLFAFLVCMIDRRSALGLSCCGCFR